MSIVSLFNSQVKPADRFERLLQPNIDVLYRFAFRLCNSQDDAEELVQQLLTRLYPKVDQLETIEKLSSWLCRSLYNLHVDNCRKLARESTIFSSEEFVEGNMPHEQTPFEEISNNEMAVNINVALDQLNKDQRILVLLHDSEGYTLTELADILQVPLGTLKSRLNRARTSLKKILSKEPFEGYDRLVVKR